MVANRKARARTAKLTDRSVSDENFPHAVALLGPIAAWAEAITEGEKLTFNNRNLVLIAVEVAMAFAKAASDPKIVDAWGEADRVRQAFRAATAGRDELFAEAI